MNDQEITETVNLLKKLKPGFLPYPIFEQVARIAALPVVEMIPLRLQQNGEIEVLLIDRGPKDPLWPNMLHTPGTIIRADDLHTGEAHDWKAFQRIFHDELKDTELGAPHYVGSIFHQSKRGAEQAQLYWVEVTGVPQVGGFYPVAKLPETLIDSQLTFIRHAAEVFKEYRHDNPNA
jgi:hypothetical protein